MPKKRRLTASDIQLPVAEVLIQEDFEPIRKRVKLFKQLEEGQYELPDHKRVDAMIRILEGISDHVYPKLRSTETHGQVDHSITVEIKNYGGQLQEKNVTLSMKELGEKKDPDNTV